jgi:endoglucanase
MAITWFNSFIHPIASPIQSAFFRTTLIQNQKLIMRTKTISLRKGGGTCLVLFLLISFTTFGQTPVSVNGALKVSGNKIVNKNNATVSFSGASHFWSNTGWGGDKYYNSSVVNYFSANWHAGIIRVAMGVDEQGGYLGDASNKTRAKAVIDAAINAGLYVIIDWHTHHAESFQSQAVTFFQEMANTYGTKDNIIYEIYNEPLAVSWSGTIKPYANAVIGAIRAIDPDNLIIVGTPNWSQDVDMAANDPITGYSNIAYTLHFYAATHKAGLRAKASTALSKNIPLFVTEWGTCDASGAGSVDEASTNEWVAFMKANNMTNCNWAINDKSEAASILNPGTPTNGNWTDANLTASGKLVKGIVTGWTGVSSCTTATTSVNIQAESYCEMSGIQVEPTSDTGGGQNAGWIDTGDWLSYSVSIPSAGAYIVKYRVASMSGGGSIRLEAKGGSPLYGTITVPSTGGWQTWTTIQHTVTLPAGVQNIAIAAPSGGFNLNWFSIAPNGSNPFSLTKQAESYSDMSGVQTETTTDTGGGLDVGWIDTNDWMKYSAIAIPSAGSYLVEFRVASPNSNGVLKQDLNAGAIQLGSINVPNTGGWQNWQTISRTVNLNAGTYDFGIFASVGGWNLNWWKISTPSGGRIAFEERSEKLITLFPNPSVGMVTINVVNPSRVTILDLNGRTHFDEFVEQETSLNNLRTGIYLVRMHADATATVQKLIVK